MDKVKQIFKGDSTSDSPSSRASVGSNTAVPSTNPAGAQGNYTGGRDSIGSGRDSIGTRERESVGTTGSGLRDGRDSRESTGLASGTGATTAGSQHAHHSEHASLPGHTHNIEKRHDLPREGEGLQTHDHKHLAAVTRETHHGHEVEEVERVREVDRHVHHVQHHVQPVLDTKHHDREHVTHAHPVTHIKEQHVNTDEDKKLFGSLGSKYVDSTQQGGTDRTVVDRGEIVNENVAHHVHHVVQPVIERDTHHHKTIHTTIPVKHTTHEAPIIHQSSTHEPMQLKDFVSQGGDLKSKLTHDQAGVLAMGDCERTVDGPAESLAQKLHLGGSSHNTSSSGNVAQ